MQNGGIATFDLRVCVEGEQSDREQGAAPKRDIVVLINKEQIMAANLFENDAFVADALMQQRSGDCRKGDV